MCKVVQILKYVKKFTVFVSIFALIVMCSTVSVYAEDKKEVYVLTKTAAETQELITKYKESISDSGTETETGTETGTENNTNQKEEQEDDTNTDDTESTKIGIDITEGQICIALVEDCGTYISLRDSLPAEKWPKGLPNLYDYADNKGYIEVEYVESEIKDFTPVAYMVRSTVDCFGALYLVNDGADKFKVYLTAIKDTDFIEDASEKELEYRTMTGQVDLRDLTDEQLARLDAIKNEMSDKNTGSMAHNVGSFVMRTIGTLIIIYGVIFILAYILDMFNPLQVNFEFFKFVTFNYWRSAYCVDGFDIGLVKDIGDNSIVRLPKAILFCAIYVVVGTLCITIDWVGVVSYIFAFVNELLFT